MAQLNDKWWPAPACPARRVVDVLSLFVITVYKWCPGWQFVADKKMSCRISLIDFAAPHCWLHSSSSSDPCQPAWPGGGMYLTIYIPCVPWHPPPHWVLPGAAFQVQKFVSSEQCCRQKIKYCLTKMIKGKSLEWWIIFIEYVVYFGSMFFCDHEPPYLI